MTKLLIPAGDIRRMDVTTLRERLASLRAEHEVSRDPEMRQRYYDTYIKVTDEIARRNADPKYMPLLFKRSSVYAMSAEALRRKVAELEMSAEQTDAHVRTLEFLRHEQERRRRHDKAMYWKRKGTPCSTRSSSHSSPEAPTTSSSAT